MNEEKKKLLEEAYQKYKKIRTKAWKEKEEAFKQAIKKYEAIEKPTWDIYKTEVERIRRLK